MYGIARDLRFTLRQLLKNPSFTLLAVLTLALGIGVNSAVFSVVNAVVLRPLPVASPDRLASIYTAGRKASSFSHEPLAFPDYRDIREQSSSFEDMAAYVLSGMVYEQGAETDFVLTELAGGNYFSLLGVSAHRGRLLTEEDDAPGDPRPVAVLSHPSWQRRFGGDPAAVGSTVRLNGLPVTIVGVAEPGFLGLARGLGPELWLPIHLSTALKADSIIQSRDRTPGLDRVDDRVWRWHWAVGRLRPEVTFAAARSELETITSRLAQSFPETNEDRTYLLEPTRDVRVLPGIDGPVRTASLMVMGLTSLVLLIACFNVANMLLARGVERRKEIAIRLALGSGRGALLRQLFIENLALSLAGGGLGLGLALASNRAVESLELPIPVDLAFGLELDLSVVAFTFAAATATALIFGMAPALEATRVNLASTLGEESRGSSGGAGRRRLRSALVVVQVAFSFLLLTCAGLSVRSLRNAQLIDPGFNADGLVNAQLQPELQGYDAAGKQDFYDRLAERLEALPETRSLTFVSHLPLTVNVSIIAFAVSGEESKPTEDWPLADTAWIGGGFFATLGVPILSGRAVTREDVHDGRRVAVVNRTLAERFFPGRDAVGQRLYLDRREEPLEIVGVAGDGKYRSLNEEPRAFIYQSVWHLLANGRTLVLRSAADPGAALRSIRREARALDDQITVTNLSTVEDTLSTLVLPRLTATLFGLFGGIGTILSVVGIYGVVSYMASQRTREIGIRMAMGARRLDILTMVTRDGVVVIAAGVALGVAAASLATRMLESVLYGVSALDAATFGAVALLLAAVALAASLVPARRAAGVHPTTVLGRD
jgi:predicted permease